MEDRSHARDEIGVGQFTNRVGDASVAHNLAGPGVHVETQELGHAFPHETDGVGVADGLQFSKPLSLPQSQPGGVELADAVDDQHCGLSEGSREKGRRGMAEMMREELEAGLRRTRNQRFARGKRVSVVCFLSLRSPPIPGFHSAGVGQVHILATPLFRIQGVADGGEVLPPDTALFQAPGHGLLRKFIRIVYARMLGMADSVKSLFFDHRDNLPVAQQARRRLMIGAVDSKYMHRRLDTWLVRLRSREVHEGESVA